MNACKTRKPEKVVRAAVIGATGYAGAELARILWDHPLVDLCALTSRQYAGKPFSQVFGSMAGVIPLVCQELSVPDLCDTVDVVFTALPHKIPMSIIPQMIERGVKVVDLSADFRFHDMDRYESHYQPHTARDLTKEAVYGLCEVYGEKIQSANLVGNPGCYPTSAMLPLIPFLKKGLIKSDSIIIDSKSGVSGAGRGVSLGTHYCEVTEGFSAYKVAVHRHAPEMEEILSEQAKSPVSVVFVPHLVPMSRGMLSTSYSSLAEKMTQKDAVRVLEEFYSNCPFVRICEGEVLPKTANVRGTNYIDIALRIHEESGRLILVSVIDNLVKGAAGQAVQNMNLMFGINETAGLEQTPYPI